MVPNTKLLPRSVQWLYSQLHVTVQEEWSRITVLLANIDNTVYGTAVVTRSPLLDKIAYVDNVRVRSDWNRHPGFSRRIPDLKTL